MPGMEDHINISCKSQHHTGGREKGFTWFLRLRDLTDAWGREGSRGGTHYPPTWPLLQNPAFGTQGPLHQQPISLPGPWPMGTTEPVRTGEREATGGLELGGLLY